MRVASVLFGIFAIGHLLRLINQAQVTVGTLTLPMGLSWIALIVATILGDWLQVAQGDRRDGRRSAPTLPLRPIARNIQVGSVQFCD